MADIAIQPLQRRQLPPSRVGPVKPPLSLADTSAEAGLAFATAKFAGDHFNKLVATKAANEFATFQGLVNTEIENFNTIVKSRPGASFDELQSERNKMVARLDAASKNATTRAGKQAIKNYMLANKGLIQAKTQTNMVAIRVRQQLATAEEHIKNFMNTGDIDGLEAFYFGENGLVQAELMEGKFAKAQFANQKAIMVEANKKIQLEQVKTGLETRMFQMAAEHGYEAAEARLRDPQTTARLLEAGVRREDIKSLLTDVSERMKHEKVVADEKLDAQREVDRGDIYDAINVGEVKLPGGSTSTDIRKFIEQSSLDEDEQEEMWQKSIKETERKLKGEDIITNARVRSQFYKQIPLMLSGAVTRDDLLNRANLARFGDYTDPKNPIDPTLDDPAYKSIVAATNAQYEQGYGQVMSKVNTFAEGILLKTDSLGFVANAPVRYKTLGDFQQAWFDFVAAKGDKLKIADIYPEGRRLAATFQISDEEAARQEEEIDERLKQREKPIPPPIPISEADVDAVTGAERAAPSTKVKMVNKTGTVFQVLQKDIAKKEAQGWKQVGKKLTVKIARRYLQIAGGDREEAKRLAAEDGYKE